MYLLFEFKRLLTEGSQIHSLTLALVIRNQRAAMQALFLAAAAVSSWFPKCAGSHTMSYIRLVAAASVEGLR